MFCCIANFVRDCKLLDRRGDRDNEALNADYIGILRTDDKRDYEKN